MHEYPEGATPHTLEEAEGLIPPHIKTRNELNAWEQRGILKAELQFENVRPNSLLSEGFVLRLHRSMFGETWKWAGKYRLTEKNIGVPPWEIGARLRMLIDDARVWVENPSEDRDTVAARFHHRLVSIHPFANGNGRHARLMADLLLLKVLGRDRFSWGRENLVEESETRRAYLEALRAADRRNLGPLLQFARS